MICNYCQLHQIENRAREGGQKVTKSHEAWVRNAPYGVRVLVHPPAVSPDQEKHFVVWFATVGSKCTC